jgi:hypothetical protein
MPADTSRKASPASSGDAEAVVEIHAPVVVIRAHDARPEGEVGADDLLDPLDDLEREPHPALEVAAVLILAQVLGR